MKLKLFRTLELLGRLYYWSPSNVLLQLCLYYTAVCWIETVWFYLFILSSQVLPLYSRKSTWDKGGIYCVSLTKKWGGNIPFLQQKARMKLLKGEELHPRNLIPHPAQICASASSQGMDGEVDIWKIIFKHTRKVTGHVISLYKKFDKNKSNMGWSTCESLTSS